MHIRKRYIIPGVITLALAGGGSAAYAAVASTSPVSSAGVIDGCYSNGEIHGSHVFVLQDQGNSCPRGTVPVTWNEQGQPGPVGPSGPAGAPGAVGATGSAGISGYEVDTCTETAQSGTCDNGLGSYELLIAGQNYFQLYCPTGKSPLSGGFNSGPVNQSNPFSNSSGSGWEFNLGGNPGAGQTVYIICADVA